MELEKYHKKELTKLKKILSVLEDEDVNTAINSGYLFHVIDKIFFPDNPAIIEYSYTSGSYIFQYDPNHDQDKYIITIPAITKKLEEARMNVELLTFKEDKGILREEMYSGLQLDSLILGVVFHEVRHRIQNYFKGSLVLFTEKTKKQDDSIINGILDFVRNLFHCEREARKKGDREVYEDEVFPGHDFRLNDKEFDAEVIEELPKYYFFELLTQQKSICKKELIKRILWMQPD